MLTMRKGLIFSVVCLLIGGGCIYCGSEFFENREPMRSLQEVKWEALEKPSRIHRYRNDGKDKWDQEKFEKDIHKKEESQVIRTWRFRVEGPEKGSKRDGPRKGEVLMQAYL